MQTKRTKKTHDVENKGLLQMQHPAVCLQGTFGDHLGGINKNNLLVFLPLYMYVTKLDHKEMFLKKHKNCVI